MFFCLTLCTDLHSRAGTSQHTPRQTHKGGVCAQGTVSGFGSTESMSVQPNNFQCLKESIVYIVQMTKNFRFTICLPCVHISGEEAMGVAATRVGIRSMFFVMDGTPMVNFLLI